MINLIQHLVQIQHYLRRIKKRCQNPLNFEKGMIKWFSVLSMTERFSASSFSLAKQFSRLSPIQLGEIQLTNYSPARYTALHLYSQQIRTRPNPPLAKLIHLTEQHLHPHSNRLLIPLESKIESIHSMEHITSYLWICSLPYNFLSHWKTFKMLTSLDQRFSAWDTSSPNGIRQIDRWQPIWEE